MAVLLDALFLHHLSFPKPKPLIHVGKPLSLKMENLVDYNLETRLHATDLHPHILSSSWLTWWESEWSITDSIPGTVDGCCRGCGCARASVCKAVGSCPITKSWDCIFYSSASSVNGHTVACRNPTRRLRYQKTSCHVGSTYGYSWRVWSSWNQKGKKIPVLYTKCKPYFLASV